MLYQRDSRWELDTPEPSGSNSEHDGTRLHLHPPVVEHVPRHLVLHNHQARCPAGRHLNIGHIEGNPLSCNGEMFCTPSAAIASLQRNSLTEERSTARPSPNLKNVWSRFFADVCIYGVGRGFECQPGVGGSTAALQLKLQPFSHAVCELP